MSAHRQPLDAGPNQGVAALVALLRAKGFALGASETADATRLLIELSAREPDLDDVARLRTRLRPVFCKTREEQERFDPVFDDWIVSLASSSPATRPPPAATLPLSSPETTWLDGRRWLVVAAVAMAALGLTIVLWWTGGTALLQSGPSSRSGQTTAAAASPPAPSPAATPPSASSPSAARRVDAFVPAGRYNRELRTAWVWLLLALPLVPLLGVSLPAMVLARTRLRRGAAPMVLDPRPLEREARRLVPALRRDVTDRLARHVRSAGLDIERLARRPVLDVRGTIEATIRNHGVPTLKFSHSRINPSYLLLVDVANERDPRGRLFFQWAERLQRQKLDVEILLIRIVDEEGTPAPVFCPARLARRDDAMWQPLARLRAPLFGERLIVVSDGDPFVDREGVWRAPATRARLYRWRDRVLFTPVEPRDWGVREEAIERSERTADPGFIVLPLEESALAAWADLVLTGLLPTMELADPQRFPALLRRGRTDGYAGEEPPDADEIDTLIAQLRIYLGTWGFQWVAACAVPPIVRWELTLLLGQAVLRELPGPLRESDVDEALALNYRRLVRLPWMQRETMPQWLRLRLLGELPSTRHRALQQLVRDRLAALSPRPIAGGIELNFERPPGERAGVERGPRRGRAETGDPLYLGYVSGMTPEQLVLRAPREWADWAQKINMRRPSGLRAWMLRLRDRSTSWWARLAWRDGLPHHGLNSRTAAVALALAVPVVVLLVAAERWPLAADVRFADNWLFVEQPRSDAWPVAGRRIFSVAFNPDGTRIAAGGEGGVQMIDSSTGAPRDRLIGRPTDRVESVAFSPGGQTVAAGLADGTIWLANATRASVTNVWRGHADQVEEVSFTRDGTSVVSAALDRTLRQWDATTAAIVDTRTLAPEATNSYLAMSPDGEWITFWRDDGVLLERTSGGSVDHLQAQPPVLALTFSASGRHLVFSNGDGTLQRAELAGDQWDRVGEPSRGHAGAVHSIAFSPDERLFVSAGSDGTLRLWDIETGAQIGEPLRGHAGVVRAVAFAPDGARLVSGGDDGVRLWDASPAEPVGEPLRGHGDRIDTLDFSPDGTRLVSSGRDGVVRLWDTRGGTLVAEAAVAGFQGAGFAVGFSGDGGVYLADGDDSEVVPWDPQTQRTLPIRVIRPDVRTIAFSPDRTRVAHNGFSGRFELWGRGQSKIAEQRHDTSFVESLAFSRDSLRLASGGALGTVRLWDAQTGASIGSTMAGHSGRVGTLMFSPDSERIASGAEDGTVRLWNARTTAPIGEPLRGHTASVSGVAFSPDGDQLASASIDGTIRLWDARTGRAIGSAIASPAGPMTAVTFGPDGRYIAAATGSSPPPAARPGPETVRLFPEPEPPADPFFFGAVDPEIRFWRLDPWPEPRAGGTVEGVRAELASALAQPDGQALVTGWSIIVAVVLVVASRRRRRQAIAREVTAPTGPS